MPLSGRIELMSSEATAGREWLSTPLGRRCLANEQRLMRRALERVFGEQLLQIVGLGNRGVVHRRIDVSAPAAGDSAAATATASSPAAGKSSSAEQRADDLRERREQLLRGTAALAVLAVAVIVVAV